MRAYLELHIEQGPVLEGEGLAVGTVLGTVGVERHRLIFDGPGGARRLHPDRRSRRDSFLAAARFALELREVARRHHGVCTVGDARCEPGVVTAVPGRTTLLSTSATSTRASLAAMLAEMRARSPRPPPAAERCTRRVGAPLAIEPIPFDAGLIAIARRRLPARSRAPIAQLPSGPLHDAAEMARRVPTVMIFSSSTNGLSHTKEEDTPVEHLELAARAYGQTARAAIESVAHRS